MKVFHPQIISQVDMFKKIIIISLRRYAVEHQNDLEVDVQQLMCAQNTMYHCLKKLSSFRLDLQRHSFRKIMVDHPKTFQSNANETTVPHVLDPSCTSLEDYTKTWIQNSKWDIWRYNGNHHKKHRRLNRLFNSHSMSTSTDHLWWLRLPSPWRHNCIKAVSHENQDGLIYSI